MIQSETITIPRSFEERRIAQFETDEVPQYRTVIRAIDMSTLSPADVKALDDLTTAFGCQIAYFL